MFVEGERLFILEKILKVLIFGAYISRVHFLIYKNKYSVEYEEKAYYNIIRLID